MSFSVYSVPPICGHPHQILYKVTISENKLCISVSNLPLTRGHPSNKAISSIPQGWPYKRGNTVCVLQFSGGGGGCDTVKS